jgi:hypothetical protein
MMYALFVLSVIVYIGGIMPERFLSSVISDKAKTIYSKLEQDRTGDTLTRSERNLEVTNEEAAYLLSALAGRTISHRYLAQLTREDKEHKRRLRPYRVVGNTYTYLVESLLGIRFIKVAEKKQQDQAKATDNAA